MPWTPAQKRMFQARAAAGDPAAKRVVQKADFNSTGAKKGGSKKKKPVKPTKKGGY